MITIRLYIIGLFNKALDSMQYYRLNMTERGYIQPIEEASLWRVDSSETVLSSAE